MLVATHNGEFHTDDICAVAVVSLIHDGNISVIRTRDTHRIAEADYKLDVGGEYDPKKKAFDHHQKGGAGLRENGIPFATFGLVWKEYGGVLCGGNKKVEQKIDEILVQPIDAADNGVTIATSIIDGIHAYTISNFFESYQGLESSDNDKTFLQLVDLAKTLITREIQKELKKIQDDHNVIKLYEASPDKRLIVSDKYYSWRSLLDKPEPLYVVFPREDRSWAIKAIPAKQNSFDIRKPLPEMWAGKSGKELEDITGVPGSIFCHNKQFIATARDREAILALAEKALQA